jgi:hypothetical protein
MAQTFLKSTDSTYKISNSGDEVFGANGVQVATIEAGVTGITVNANVEGVKFAGASTDYSFKIIDRSSLGVYSGTTLVATVAIDQADGISELTFSDVKVAAALTLSSTGALTGLTLGGTAVTTTAAPVTPVSFIEQFTAAANPLLAPSVAAHAEAVAAEADAVAKTTAYRTAVTAETAAKALAATTDAAALLVTKTAAATSLTNATVRHATALQELNAAKAD